MASEQINQNEVEQALFRIDGYYSLRPHETGDAGRRAAFDRAKAEALHHMRKDVDDVIAMSFEQFARAYLRQPYHAPEGKP